MANNYYPPMLAALAIMGVLLLGAAPWAADATIDCNKVTNDIVSACYSYFRSSGAGAVPEPCCGVIRGLNSQAKTTPDRQAVCRCLKSLANTYKNVINMSVASYTPSKCGVNLPYKIDPSIDCSKVY